MLFFNCLQDFRTNAEKARAELDQKQLKNRPIKVRFAPATVRVKVKNLAPMVSNELLEMSFSVFGEVKILFCLIYISFYLNDETTELPFDPHETYSIWLLF